MDPGFADGNRPVRKRWSGTIRHPCRLLQRVRSDRHTTTVEALEFEATYDVVFNSDPRKLRLPYGGVLAGVVARYIDPLGSTSTTGHYRFGLVLDASPTADWPPTSGLGIRIQKPYGDGAHGGDGDFRVEAPAPTDVDTDYPSGPPSSTRVGHAFKGANRPASTRGAGSGAPRTIVVERGGYGSQQLGSADLGADRIQGIERRQ